ncbi:MAG: hypothetical protein ACYTG7_02735 [Planctomycetota bacterium]
MRRSRFSHFLYVVFRKDIGRKAMALLLALVLWFYLDQQVVLRQTHSLSIQVVSGEQEYYQISGKMTEGFFIVLPENLMLMQNLQDNTLNIVLSGPKDMIQTNLIGRKNITGSDIGEFPQRRIQFNLIKEFFDALRAKESIGVEFHPPRITLTVAKRADTEILLTRDNLDLRGLKALQDRQVNIEDVDFNPNTISIEGPMPVIDEIEANPNLFKLESMVLGSGEIKRRDLRLAPELRAKKISIMGNDFVRVNVTLREEESERLLEDVDVLVFFRAQPLTPEERARIELQPGKVGVSFRGPHSQIDLLPADHILKRKVIVKIDLADADVESQGLTLDEIMDTLIPFELRLLPDSGFRLSSAIRIEPVIEGNKRTIDVNKVSSE